MPSDHPAAARLQPSPFTSGIWLRDGQLYSVIFVLHDCSLVAQPLIPDSVGLIHIDPAAWVPALSLPEGGWQLLMDGAEIIDDRENGYPVLTAIMAEHCRQPDELDVWNRLLAEQAEGPGPDGYRDEVPEYRDTWADDPPPGMTFRRLY